MTLRWTKPATKDLTQICDYTEERFGAVQAQRAAMVIYEAANSLQAMPMCGRNGRKRGTRELVLTGLPFLIIYRLSQDSVEILRILHGAQKWP